MATAVGFFRDAVVRRRKWLRLEGSSAPGAKFEAFSSCWLSIATNRTVGGGNATWSMQLPVCLCRIAEPLLEGIIYWLLRLCRQATPRKDKDRLWGA